MPEQIGPVRSSRVVLHRLGRRVASVYVHSGGSPQALAMLRSKGRGQYVYNADEFRYERHRSTGITTRFAPHNLYTDRRRSCARPAGSSGAKDKDYKTVWQFAPDAPLETRPYGGTITVGYPYNTIKYKYDRKSNTYLRSVTGETKQTDAADGTRIAPEERHRHADAIRAAQRRACRRASARSDGRRQRAPPGSRPTAGRSRAPGRRPR